MARQFQGPGAVKVISLPATEHGAIQAANTAMFGVLMQAGNLVLPKEAYGDAFRVTFAKKHRLIAKNLEKNWMRGPRRS
jgi:Pyruvate/2-oxoacid:ferredoxin oxidoreductase gamma subunit